MAGRTRVLTGGPLGAGLVAHRMVAFVVERPPVVPAALITSPVGGAFVMIVGTWVQPFSWDVKSCKSMCTCKKSMCGSHTPSHRPRNAGSSCSPMSRERQFNKVEMVSTLDLLVFLSVEKSESSRSSTDGWDRSFRYRFGHHHDEEILDFSIRFDKDIAEAEEAAGPTAATWKAQSS